MEKEGEGGRAMEGEGEMEMERRRDGETDRQTDRQTERQTDRETDRQRDRQRDRQTDRERRGCAGRLGVEQCVAASQPLPGHRSSGTSRRRRRLHKQPARESTGAAQQRQRGCGRPAGTSTQTCRRAHTSAEGVIAAPSLCKDGRLVESAGGHAVPEQRELGRRRPGVTRGRR